MVVRPSVGGVNVNVDRENSIAMSTGALTVDALTRSALLGGRSEPLRTGWKEVHDGDGTFLVEQAGTCASLV